MNSHDSARVLYKNGRFLVVLGHPTKTLPGLNRYGFIDHSDDDEDLGPKFAVTQQGFRCYASKSVEPLRGNPDEAYFHGTQYPSRGPHIVPRYNIHVKL